MMHSDLLTVVKAPCVPFSARPRGRAGGLIRPSRTVHCSAQHNADDDQLQSAVKQLGRACAPFAAAILLLSQANPAIAETQFEASVRTQKEFLSGKNFGGFESFFKKGAGAVKEGASSAVNAGRNAAPEVPVSSPVITAKDAILATGKDGPSPKIAPPIGGAFDSAKKAFSDAASSAQSTAKAAAPDDASSAGKEAASNIAEGAKSIAKSSQEEAEVAGTGDSTPSGRGLTSRAVDSAKDAVGVSDPSGAASSAANEAKGNLLNVGNPFDAAKSAAGDVKDSAPSLPNINPIDKMKKSSEEARGPNQAGGGPSNLDNAAAGDVKGIAPSIGGGNSANSGSAEPASAPAPGGGSALDSAADSIQSVASNVTDSAKDTGSDVQNVAGNIPTPDAPKPNFLTNFFGSDQKPLVAQPVAQPAPQPSDLEEKLPKGVPPLPDQPAPEPESKQLGADTAGGKVQDVARGSGVLDLFGGDKTGQSPASKAEELVDEAKKPNPASGFIGNLLGIDAPKDDNPSPSYGLSALPTSNEVGTIAAEQLEAPQPSALEEAGNLPESAPGEEIKLPEQPAPETPPPEQLGQDSAGGQTGSTKSGGGILDFFGGSQSKSSMSMSRNGNSQQSASLAFNKPLVMVADQLPPPQPSDFDEKEPESAPGEQLQPEEQPYPEPESKDLPQDNPGGETDDTKRGSGSLNFFGGSGGDSEKAAEKNIEKAKSATNTITPDSAKVGLKLSSGPEEAVSLIAEAEAVEEPKDAGKVTAIGLGLSLLLEIIIFSIQPTAAPAKH